jgi:hypothetical protein
MEWHFGRLGRMFSGCADAQHLGDDGERIHVTALHGTLARTKDAGGLAAGQFDAGPGQSFGRVRFLPGP